MSTEQLQAEVSALEAKTQRPLRTTSLVASEDTAANPMGGVLENVPATIVAPVPGPPDFNGASAVIARLPNIGFAPSMLEEKGFESRGTFTVRQSRAGESFYLRIYGKLNHNIRCTIRGCVPPSLHRARPSSFHAHELRPQPCGSRPEAAAACAWLLGDHRPCMKTFDWIDGEAKARGGWIDCACGAAGTAI